MRKWLSNLAFLWALVGGPQPPIGTRGAMAAEDVQSICEAPICEPRDMQRPDPVRLETARLQGDRYLADRESGAIAELTLDPRLQAATERQLRRAQIMYGASVVLSIPDGRVLALAGHSSIDASQGPTELALRPWAPAASVFKIVSAAALIDEAGLSRTTRACYHGGTSSVLPDNLIDNPRRDRCASLAYGVGKSQNAILAKLAVRYLSPEQLARTGRALGFGETLAFDLDIEPSHLDVPEGDPLEFARAAAGFWHSTLSPMHGALLAAAIADGGRMMTPHLVEPGDDDDDDDGATAPDVASVESRQVLSANAAAEVAEMMAGVTRMGTARTTFHDRHGHQRLSISAAGKTGTLFGKTVDGPVGYSWFVGFAPIENPTVAFAVALGTRPGVRLRASEVARELLSEYAAAEKQATNGAVGGTRPASKSPASSTSTNTSTLHGPRHVEGRPLPRATAARRMTAAQPG